MAPTPTEVDEAPNAAEAALKAAGKPTEDTIRHDYFAFEETLRVPLSDGTSYIEHKVLNEGAKRQYLNKTNRSVKVSRVTQEASITSAPGDERHALLEAAITGWDLQTGGQSVPFNKDNLRRFLEVADPRVIDDIEKAIRLANPWLLQEMSVEDIDKEIAALQELRTKKVEEEEGKSDSRK